MNQSEHCSCYQGGPPFNQYLLHKYAICCCEWTDGKHPQACKCTRPKTVSCARTQKSETPHQVRGKCYEEDASIAARCQEDCGSPLPCGHLCQKPCGTFAALCCEHNNRAVTAIIAKPWSEDMICHGRIKTDVLTCLTSSFVEALDAILHFALFV